MSPLGIVMAVLLVLIAVSLVVVPYLRAGAEPVPAADGGADRRADVERRLHENYCLDCGMKFDHPGQSPCPNCGGGGDAR